MTSQTLLSFLRTLTDKGTLETDAELLRRFVATREEEAFASLVKRHGQLVWSVCRHLTRSDADADDAFQATFLVLVRNAARIKDAAKLSAWLHGVAYKVCGKSRQADQRRAKRESATAPLERNGHAVPDSAWDKALAAVHEEVDGLPDSLRVPFVLCCLEGKGQTEAAEQLGWKLGTLSGRLTRAKDVVVERLNARGFTLGVLATVGIASVPTATTARAFELSQVGVIVPKSIHQLATGVIGMSVHKVKLLAAAVLVACGLSIGGTGWVASGRAQSFPSPAKTSPVSPVSPTDRVKQLEAELERARADAARAEDDARLEAHRLSLLRAMKAHTIAPDATNTTKANDYLFVQVSPMDQRKFMAFLQEHEDKGWVFSGTTPMEDPKSLLWVFRRAKAGTSNATPTPMSQGQYGFGSGGSSPAFPSRAPSGQNSGGPKVPGTPPTGAIPTLEPGRMRDAAEVIEDEIRRLQDKLNALKKSKPQQ